MATATDANVADIVEAVLAALESLLSAVVADGNAVDKPTRRFDPDAADYHGGYEETAEGYAKPAEVPA